MVNNLPWPLVSFEKLFSEPLRNGIYKQKEFHGRGCKIVNMGELFAHPRLSSNIEMSRVELTEKEKEKLLLKSGDLIFARRSLTAEGAGKCTLILGIDEETTFESSIIRVRLDKNKALPDFYYYLFDSPIGKWLLGTILRQTAVSGITGGDLSKLLVPQPPLNIQQQLIDSGRLLDDKIHLNRQINQTLEQMAQALFKSWFVDFDPVVDNALDAGFFEQNLDLPDELLRRAEARQAARNRPDFKPLPDATRQLFPAAFEACTEPSLGLGGWVPKGWETHAISDIAFINKESWTKNNSPQNIKYVDLSNAKDGIILGIQEYLFEEAPSRARRVLNKRDTIFGMVRPANRSFAYVDRDGLTGSTGFVVISAKNENASSFIYQRLTSDSVVDELIRVADGAAYPAIKPDDISELMMAVPKKCILELFEKTIDGYRERVAHNLDNNEQLAKLRDTLLPKLISGELRLDNIAAELATE